MEWVEKNNCLVKTFTFSKFVNAFTFMADIAVLAEKMSHQAGWENKFQTVTIRLTTHGEVDSITEKDRNMALMIDDIYSKMRK
jgi:4a-hydroxytetrahydrobiopterin dehydratase